MIDILNLALPYFGLIFIGFACGRSKGLPEAGLAWMNFFLLYVSLPALLFGIMSKTPFEELNNPPFLIATTLGTMSAFVLAMSAGRIICDRAAKRQLDRARIRRHADRNVRVRHHAHQRDVVHSSRPACASLK
jgi:malonate transporter and related proteins